MILIYTRLVGQTFEKPTENSVGFLFSAKQALCNQQFKKLHTCPLAIHWFIRRRMGLSDILRDTARRWFLHYTSTCTIKMVQK